MPAAWVERKLTCQIIFDSHLRLRSNSKVVKTIAAGPLVVFCGQAANAQEQIKLKNAVLRLSSQKNAGA